MRLRRAVTIARRSSGRMKCKCAASEVELTDGVYLFKAKHACASQVISKNEFSEIGVFRQNDTLFFCRPSQYFSIRWIRLHFSQRQHVMAFGP